MRRSDVPFEYLNDTNLAAELHPQAFFIVQQGGGI